MSKVNKSFIKSLKTDLSKHMYSEIMRNSIIGDITEWIPSDFIDFNRICSGDLRYCLPAGKTLCVAGPEGSGKTMIIMNLFKHAQRLGYHAICFETEGAWTDEFCEAWGVDPDNLLYNYVAKIEDVIVGLEEIKDKLSDIRKSGGEEPKIIMALDSLGNLDSYKKDRDAEKGKAVLDQGLQTRYIKSLFKTIKEVTTLFHIPFIFSNHLVANPNSMSSIEQLVGGKAPRLQSDIIAVLHNTPLRENPEVKSSRIIGSDVTVRTRKNRFYPPFQEAKMEIDFSNGPNKYAGMIDRLIDMGIIVKEGRKHVFNGEKYWYKDLKDVVDLNEETIETLNAELQKTGYSSFYEEVEPEEEE